MDLDLVKVVKEHIEKGPTYKLDKRLIEEMCNKLGIHSISQFYDVLIESLRCRCEKNFWQHLHGLCLDSEGDHIAYGKDVISEALGKPEKELTCHDICEVCGSCAYINSVSSALFFKMCEMMDEKGLKLDYESKKE